MTTWTLKHNAQANDFQVQERITYPTAWEGNTGLYCALQTFNTVVIFAANNQSSQITTWQHYPHTSFSDYITVQRRSKKLILPLNKRQAHTNFSEFQIQQALYVLHIKWNEPLTAGECAIIVKYWCTDKALRQTAVSPFVESVGTSGHAALTRNLGVLEQIQLYFLMGITQLDCALAGLPCEGIKKIIALRRLHPQRKKT